MTYSIASSQIPSRHNPFDLRIFFAAVVFILTGVVFSYSQISATSTETFTVDDVPDQEVVCYGKTVIVKTRAKGVLAIGGDVFAVGGAYRPENPNPLREEGRETVMYAGYEEEIRDLAQNPSSLFSPHFTLTFLAWRVLSVLFWFVLSLGLTTLAPGAVSRAIARFQLSTLKVIAIGAGAFLLTTAGVIGSSGVLPDPLGVILGMMALFLLMLAYVFGRVALNVFLGKLLQKSLLGEKYNSEALAILIGVLGWTLLLSIPYVWTLALFILFSTGVGLVLTARSQSTWQV